MQKDAKGKVCFVPAEARFIGAADSRMYQEYSVPGLWVLGGFSSSHLLTSGTAGCLNGVLRRLVWGRCELKWPRCSAVKRILCNFFLSIIERLA